MAFGTTRPCRMAKGLSSSCLLKDGASPHRSYSSTPVGRPTVCSASLQVLQRKATFCDRRVPGISITVPSVLMKPEESLLRRAPRSLLVMRSCFPPSLVKPEQPNALHSRGQRSGARKRVSPCSMPRRTPSAWTEPHALGKCSLRDRGDGASRQLDHKEWRFEAHRSSGRPWWGEFPGPQTRKGGLVGCGLLLAGTAPEQNEVPWGYETRNTNVEGRNMLAVGGIGIVGILVIVLIVLGIIYFMRRS